MRLTDANNWEATYAYFNQSFSAVNASVYASFDYTAWGGNGADGITFFLFDGSKTFAAGAYGGGLGYAQRNFNGEVQNGMNGGYLGIGIDEFGNYSAANEGKVGGIGVFADAIAVRGPGQGQTGYSYLGGTGTIGSGIDIVSATRPDQTGANYRHVVVAITPTNQLSVYLQVGANGTLNQILSLDVSGYARPDTLKFGFSAGTGGQNNVHEIRDLNISAVTATLWDNGSGTASWADAANWNPDYLPTNYAALLFDNTSVSSAQTINVGVGQTRSVRSITIDAPFSYVFSNGTLQFNKNGNPSASGIFVSSTKGSATGQTINSNIALSNAIEIQNQSTSTLNIAGAIATNGNSITLDGSGTTSISGTISGVGNLIKTDAGTAYLNAANTYSGGTTLTNGTLSTNNNGGYGSGAISLNGGILSATSNAIAVGNPLTLTANSSLSSITTSGTLTQSGNSYTLTMAGATHSGILKLSEGNTARALTIEVNSGNSTITGQIQDGGTGAGSLTKTGQGTLILSGTNSYSGGTNITGGTLQLGAPNILNPAGALNINGGNFNLAGFSQRVGTLSYSNNGSMDFGAGATTNNFTFGNLGNQQGTLVVNNWGNGAKLGTTGANQWVPNVYLSGYGSATENTNPDAALTALYGVNVYLLTAAAQNWITWQGANNAWGTAGNWNPNTNGGPGANNNNNVFVSFDGTTANTTSALGSNRYVSGLRFNIGAQSYNITGNNQTLTVFNTNGGVPAYVQQKSSSTQTISVTNIQLNNPTVFDVTGSGDLAISSNINGWQGFIKDGTGSGRLILSGNNSYGNTSINNGILQIRSNAALSSWGQVSVADGASLELYGGLNNVSQNITASGLGYSGAGAIHNVNGTNTITNTITASSSPTLIAADIGTTLNFTGNLTSAGLDYTFGGAGAINVAQITSGAGNVVSNSTGTVTFNGGGTANTYTGTTTVNSGTIVLNKNANTNAIAGNLVINGGSVQLLASNQIADTSAITLNSTGNFNLASQSETISQISSSSTTASITLGSGALTVNSALTSNYAGSISGTGGSLTKNGSGALYLSGASSYTGGTTLASGILDVSNGASLGTGSVTVQSGGNLQIGNNVIIANAMNINGPGSSASDGALQNSSGNNVLSGFITLSGNARIQSDAGTLNLTNTSANGIGLGGNTLTVGGYGDVAISGTISGTGSIVKNGSGTLSLSGANSFTGSTTINQGTVKLGANSTLPTSAFVNLASGATFDVNGTINRISQLNSTGGTLAIGSGALTVGDATNNTFTGSITGTGSLIKQGAGTLTISSALNFGGTMNVTGGILEFGSSASGSSIGDIVLNNSTLKLNNGSLNIGTITVLGTSTIDFGSGSVTLNAGTLVTDGNARLNVINWTDVTDSLLATSWRKDGNTYGYQTAPSRGQSPLNQVVFNGYAGSNTAWMPYQSNSSGVVTPVPEPSFYGAVFTGAAILAIGYRRFRIKLSSDSKTSHNAVDL